MTDGAGIDQTRSYTYDEDGRLATVRVIDHNEGGKDSRETSYTYDAAGNRETEVNGEETTVYTYNDLNQLMASITTREEEVEDQEIEEG